MDVSVIIVNYQSEKHLQTCFASLDNVFQNYSYEIILINNDPEISLDLFKKDFTNLSIINNELNKGFAHACNLGAESAKGGILFFLNPDTEITEKHEGNFLDIFSDQLVAAAAPQLLLPNSNIQPWSCGKKLDFYALLINNFRRKDTFNYGATEFDWASGAAIFVKKEIFEKVGGFDESFFMYFEDVDLCFKIKNLGKKIVRLSEFSVIHFGGQSYLSTAKQKVDYYRSQNYYFRKNFGFLTFIAVAFLRQCFLLVKILKKNFN